jgi:hypothetical protein
MALTHWPQTSLLSSFVFSHTPGFLSLNIRNHSHIALLTYFLSHHPCLVKSYFFTHSPTFSFITQAWFPMHPRVWSEILISLTKTSYMNLPTHFLQGFLHSTNKVHLSMLKDFKCWSIVKPADSWYILLGSYCDPNGIDEETYVLRGYK